uniref:Uncharacterized protein n=1 Tax=viral metagenome TaxID=1070528 RepID=A0A6C0BB42_9ZZZZ
MKGYYLSFTTLFLLFPIIIYINNPKKTVSETILAFLLFANISFSFFFWLYPTQNSIIHLYDGVLAKISYIVFFIYILFIKEIKYKFKLLFLMIFLFSAGMFYYSNHYSKESWCSKQHLVCHSLFHLLISIGSAIAFL